MKIKDVIRATHNVQNIVVTFRDNGKYVIEYCLGEFVTPPKYHSFVEETEEGDLYRSTGSNSDFYFDKIINATPFGDDPEKVIPKKILDAEIDYMIPWNVNHVQYDHYQYEFTVDIGEKELPKPKSKKKKDDGQMCLELEEL